MKRLGQTHRKHVSGCQAVSALTWEETGAWSTGTALGPGLRQSASIQVEVLPPAGVDTGSSQPGHYLSNMAPGVPRVPSAKGSLRKPKSWLSLMSPHTQNRKHMSFHFGDHIQEVLSRVAK